MKTHLPSRIAGSCRSVAVAAALFAGSAAGADYLSPVPPWNAASREETYKWFMENEYGIRPPSAEHPEVSFSPLEPDKVMMDGAALRKRVKISYRGPFGTGSFSVTAFIPVGRTKPVPSFVNLCISPEGPRLDIDPERVVKDGRWPAEEIVRRGYAAITFHVWELTPDYDTGATAGVFAVYEKPGQYRDMRYWGVLSAWAWGASRVMDWIVAEPLLDWRHVGVVGHSRGGKTALLTGVMDARYAMACVTDSGCSGMKLNRMDLPKSEHTGFMACRLGYWFCYNYGMWAHAPEKAPFDQHQFAALMAPRLLAVASASDDAWAGPEGEYESCVRASGAWESLGVPGLVSTGYPRPNEVRQEGRISYHLKEGEHAITPFDWKCYMDFADRHGWLK